MNKSFIETVRAISACAENVPLCEKSSFRIGGAARLCAFPKCEAELVSLAAAAREKDVAFEVLGNMTNVLAPDSGYDGLLIFTTSMCDMRFDGSTVTAECGTPITPLAFSAGKKGLSGLEFAYGIPGTVGGAIFMNAGAYGGEMKDVVASVRSFSKTSGEIREYSSEECGFRYRGSRFREGGEIIISAAMVLAPGDPDEIGAVMKKNMDARKEKQPLDRPSAGSTFKRPEGYFAGKLIEDAGLKGYRIGGAAVSEKHAGFVVNEGGATERDVSALVEYIKKKVFENSGVTLEEEIIHLGRG